MNSRSGSGGAPCSLNPVVEGLPGRPVRAVVLGAERGPLARGRRPAARRTPAGCRRPGPRAGCRTTIRTNGAPAVISAGKATTLSSTMTSGRDPVEDLAQLRLAVHRAVDQRLPGRLDERLELLDRGLAELRRGVADEVLPELPGVLARPRPSARRREVDQVLLEAECGEPAPPRRLGREDHPVPPAPQYVADADAVVGRPVRRLGHEQDGQRDVRHRLSCDWRVGLRGQRMPLPHAPGPLVSTRLSTSKPAGRSAPAAGERCQRLDHGRAARGGPYKRQQGLRGAAPWTLRRMPGSRSAVAQLWVTSTTHCPELRSCWSQCSR